MAKIFDNPDYWFNGTNKKTKKSSGSAGGLTLPSFRSVQNNTKKGIASANKKTPQVMVKISGASKDAGKAQAHATYIGRNGKLELENERGEKFTGKDQKKVLQSWSASGFPEKEGDSNKKEAFHIVFSMPKGTDPEGLKKAVNNLIKQEFEGHKYFTALHLDTEKPHVHLLLSATDDRGARLNPRKADLHNYRIQFALKLQEQGIDATASKKIHRFDKTKTQSQKQIHKAKRENVVVEKKPTQDTEKAINKRNEVIKAYKEYQAQHSNDTELKREIDKLLNEANKDKGKGMSR